MLIDTVDGFSFNGGSGNDYMETGAGESAFSHDPSVAGIDTIKGGAGFDTYEYATDFTFLHDGGDKFGEVIARNAMLVAMAAGAFALRH